LGTQASQHCNNTLFKMGGSKPGVLQIGPEIKNILDDMTITHWRTIKVNYEKIIIAILSHVRSRELSMEKCVMNLKIKIVELFLFMLGQ
jgi:hypothetical protein